MVLDVPPELEGHVRRQRDQPPGFLGIARLDVPPLDGAVLAGLGLAVLGDLEVDPEHLRLEVDLVP
ncbi:MULTISPECIES: hypothetical protein [Kitasatospora]|uniref:hypothetical protein n=1 Tax=Kitasatospora TaxID=2063 RepID=UPI003CD0AC97